MQQDLFSGLPGFPMGLGGVMPPFPPFLQPQMMMGFDLNAPLFQPRPQLYDTHVPLVPSPKPRTKNRPNQKDKMYNNNKNQNQKNNQQNKQQINKQGQKANGAAAARKKEELDDLAMLGIDASDVGAGI